MCCIWNWSVAMWPWPCRPAFAASSCPAVRMGVKRIGKDGRIFPMLKFRTMLVGAEAKLPSLQDRSDGHGPLFKLRDDPRPTRIGGTLREAPSSGASGNGAGHRPKLANKRRKAYLPWRDSGVEFLRRVKSSFHHFASCLPQVGRKPSTFMTGEPQNSVATFAIPIPDGLCSQTSLLSASHSSMSHSDGDISDERGTCD
jgi:hypothetical protein